MTRQIVGFVCALFVSIWGGALSAQERSDVDYFAQSIIRQAEKNFPQRLVPVAHRKHVNNARLTVFRVGDEFDPACRSPAAIAFAQEGMIGVCIGNIQYLSATIMAHLQALYLDKSLRTERDTVIYMRELAKSARENAERTSADDPYTNICDFHEMTYLLNMGREPVHCQSIGLRRDAEFEAWWDKNAKAGKVYADEVRSWDPRRFSQLSDEAVMSLATDVQYHMYLEQAIYFYIYHEYGHLALGHLGMKAGNMCTMVERELSADDFAVRAMSKTKALDGSGSVFPVFRLMAINDRALSELVSVNPRSDELSAARMSAYNRSIQKSFREMDPKEKARLLEGYPAAELEEELKDDVARACKTAK